MKLISCYVAGFGKLTQFEYRFHDGVNTIVEENGWGKTTFAAFIKAMFYGMPSTTKRSVLENERKKYLPWQGGSYGGNLVFTKDNNTYRIERFFGEKDKDDTFVLYHQETGLISHDYSENIGEELFGIDLTGYERSTYIAQNAAFVAANDSMNAKLSHLVEDGNDINHYENAVADLEEAMRFYKKTGNKGRIAELESSLAEVDRKLERTVGCEEALHTWNEELLQKKADMEAISAERQAVKKRMSAAGTYEAQRAKCAHYRTLCEERTRIITERQSVIDFFRGKEPTEEELLNSIEKQNSWIDIGAQMNTEENKMDFFEKEFKEAKNAPVSNSKVLSIVLGILAVVFWGIAAIIFVRMTSVFGAIGSAIAGLILFVLFLFMISRSRRTNTSREQKVNALSDKYHTAKKRYEELRQIKEQYEREIVGVMRFYFSDMTFAEARDCIEELKLAKKRLKDTEAEYERLSTVIEVFERQNPDVIKEVSDINVSDLGMQSPVEEDSLFARLQEEEKATEQRAEALHNTLLNIEDKIAELQSILEEREEYESDRERIVEELLLSRERFELLEDTLKYLKKAKDVFSTHYLDNIKRGFEKYLKLLCENVSGHAAMDIKFGVKVESYGVKRDLDYFSEGYKDLIGLCARFALVDALFEGEAPFIILDDPFANLDEDKVDKALSLLSKIGEEYQVIYFVCHRSRATQQ